MGYKAILIEEKKGIVSHLRVWIQDHKWYLLILGVLVFLVYANSLPNEFVSDDRGIVLHVSSLDTIAANPNTLLRTLLYFVIYKIAGLNPTLMRLPNIFFHLGTVWLIFYFLRKTASLTLAFLASVIFAVHPILVEPIVWISGGVYVQYSFFFLLSFVLYVFGKDNRKLYIVSLISFALMLITSEKSIALVFAFPLYEFSFGGLRKNWKRFSPYFLLCGTSILFNFAQIGQRRALYLSDNPSDQVFMNPLQQIPIAITSYLEFIFWPDKLTLYHTEMVFTQVQFFLRAIIFVLFIGLILFCYKKNRLLFFWFSFLFVFLSLTLTPLGITWIVAERYIYLGSLGIFVGIAWVFAKFMEKKTLRAIAITVFSIIIMGLSIRTIARNVDWYNEDNLWLAAARTSPSSSQNHNNLGDYYGRHKDLESSVREYKRAIELKPNYADAYHNLGNAYRDMGKPDEAIQAYEKALSFNPAIWQSYQNIAVIYYLEGKFEQALAYAEKGLTIDPKNSSLYLTKGVILLKLGRKVEAKQILQAIVAIDPTNQLALQGLREIEGPQK
jgi:tetratricopeptide (TPR) repeat protein